MESYRELERQGMRTYWSLMGKGVLSVGKLLITSASDIKRLRNAQAEEERYIRPPRRYELPANTDWADVPNRDEPYLRPTRFCDCRAPEVVALAHALGAGVVSDQKYAERAFAFAKENLTLEIAPIDGVAETLRRGTGTCFQLITVFIALCRAAGIPARYKIYAADMIRQWRAAVIDVAPLVKKWYDSLGYFLLEGEGEAYIDGEWKVAHAGPTAERQASGGIPITRFGEDSLGIWFFAQPGTVMQLEALPPGLALGTRLLHTISPASLERVNVSVQRQIAQGREIIDQAGGPEAYDAQARSKRPTSDSQTTSTGGAS